MSYLLASALANFVIRRQMSFSDLEDDSPVLNPSKRRRRAGPASQPPSLQRRGTSGYAFVVVKI